MGTQVSNQVPYWRDKNFIPRLENGDRLTREEFHRRYEAMPKNVKAELIKGIVYMPSPVRLDNHGKPQADLMSFLGFYRMRSPGLVLADNVTYFARDDYEPQPDIVLRLDEKFGGSSWVNEGGYLEGSPELVAEISSSTVSYDLHDKLEIYEKKGVQEYIVWRVLDEQIDWFHLVKGRYEKFLPDTDGIIESEVFPGLRLNVNALLSDDTRTLISDMETGMTSKKYLDFVKRLEKHGASR